MSDKNRRVTVNALMDCETVRPVMVNNCEYSNQFQCRSCPIHAQSFWMRNTWIFVWQTGFTVANKQSFNEFIYCFQSRVSEMPVLEEPTTSTNRRICFGLQVCQNFLLSPAQKCINKKRTDDQVKTRKGIREREARIQFAQQFVWSARKDCQNSI